jgi:hypothetical protein
MTERQESSAVMERPAGVWIIALYAALSTVAAIGGLYALMSGNAVAALEADFWGTALSLVFHVCIAGGAFFLFLMRRWALVFFLAALVFDLSATVWQMLVPGALDAVSALGWTVLAAEWAIIAAIIFYIAYLSRNGFLR